jgi:hypothetical protein
MAIPYQALSIGLGMASSIPQWLQGKKQEDRAEELGLNLRRPTLGVPESQQRALTSAEEQAKMTRLPGQSAIEGRLDQTTANTIAMLERLGGGGPTTINAASRAYGNQMDKEAELGVQAGNMFLRNQDILRNELGQTADYEQQAWNYNERMPYEQKAAAIEALKEASIKNKNAAFTNVFGSLSSLFGGMGSGEGGFDFTKLFGGEPTDSSIIANNAASIGQNDPSSFLYGTNTMRKANNWTPVLESFKI